MSRNNKGKMKLLAILAEFARYRKGSEKIELNDKEELEALVTTAIKEVYFRITKSGAYDNTNTEIDQSRLDYIIWVRPHLFTRTRPHLLLQSACRHSLSQTKGGS